MPFGALCAAQLVGRVVPPIERTAKVAEVLPQDAEAQLHYGKALHQAGRVEEAIGRYEFAINKSPRSRRRNFIWGWLGAIWQIAGDKTSVRRTTRIWIDPFSTTNVRFSSIRKNGKCESNLGRNPGFSRGFALRRVADYEHSLSVNTRSSDCPQGAC